MRCKEVVMVTALRFGCGEELRFSAAMASRTRVKPGDSGLELGCHGDSGPHRWCGLGAVAMGVPSKGRIKQAKATQMRASGGRAGTGRHPIDSRERKRKEETT